MDSDMGQSESRIDYRGYVLIQYLVSFSATNRIKRPDGTWRDSPPTLLGEGKYVWCIRKRLPSGPLLEGLGEELATVDSEEEARRCVDAWCDGHR
jgi:hypothetical protein